jgi:hypothetical protein
MDFAAVQKWHLRRPGATPNRPRLPGRSSFDAALMGGAPADVTIALRVPHRAGCHWFWMGMLSTGEWAQLRACGLGRARPQHRRPNRRDQDGAATARSHIRNAGTSRPNSGRAGTDRSGTTAMDCSIAALRLLLFTPAVAAVGLALGLPSVAEARWGGGGGVSGFHGGGVGAFYGGGLAFGGGRLATGGGAFAPRAAAAPHGLAAPRVTILPQGFRHSAVPRAGMIVAAPRGHHHTRSLGMPGIPLLFSTTVPPLIGTTVPPFGISALRPLVGSAAPTPVYPGVVGAEVWRRDGNLWRLDPAPRPATTWRRGTDGRWHPLEGD